MGTSPVSSINTWTWFHSMMGIIPKLLELRGKLNELSVKLLEGVLKAFMYLGVEGSFEKC